MTATETLWTVNRIKDAVRAAGSHWFDPDTMKFFGTRVLSEVYQGPGGIYFVTSDHTFDRQRRYTVRSFNPESADIGTVGELASMTKGKAQRLAKKSAAGSLIGYTSYATEQEGGMPVALGGLSVTAEPFRPVSVLQQFIDDLEKHGTSGETCGHAAGALIFNAKKHHRYMGLLCSDESFCSQVNEDGEHPRVVALRERIEHLAKEAGASGVLFSGDPRGCTVKLVFADGFTNDFAKEGYCVPTEE